MMLAPVLTTPPAADLMSTAEAKAHLRVDFSDDDTYIGTLIKASQGWLDGWSGYLGRALITQTWSQSYCDFHRRMRLPLAPVQSIDEITYYDDNGDEQTWASSNYRLQVDGKGPYVEVDEAASYPTIDRRDDAVTVSFIAGYGASSTDVPPAIIQAAKMLIGHWYENREAVVIGTISSDVSVSVQAILRNYRLRSL